MLLNTEVRAGCATTKTAIPSFALAYLDRMHLVIAAVVAFYSARMGFVSVAVPLAWLVVHIETAVRQVELASIDERAARLAQSMTNPCSES